jgi:hypothetical protein
MDGSFQRAVRDQNKDEVLPEDTLRAQERQASLQAA